MTDRIRTLTVFLDADYRDDDIERITTAICMVKGVLRVEPRVVTAPDIIARAVAKGQLRREIATALGDVLRDDKP